MTPKEKANKLIEIFYNATYKDSRALEFKAAFYKNNLMIEAGSKGLDSIGRAKECALICVNQIRAKHFDDWSSQSEWWNDVKKEIEKL